MPDITKKQLQYLSFIHAYTEGFGEPPSMQEIGAAIGVSAPSVNGMLKTLEAKGLIERQVGVARSIEICVDPSLIPAWSKKLRSKAISVWAPANATQEWLDARMDGIIADRRTARHQAKREKAAEALEHAGKSLTVYHFKISLDEFEPAIWRRIETFDVTLADFHLLIQLAMGWTNSHLHTFEIAGQRYMESELVEVPEERDYSGVTIGSLIEEHGSRLKIRYEYDFGDSWIHTITLESTFVVTDDFARYPRCFAGLHNCPPEDVGGVWGFAEFLSAIDNPADPRYDQMLELYGPYEFDDFNVKVATEAMQSISLRKYAN